MTLVLWPEEKVEGEDAMYSIRIGLDYRALAVMNRNRIVWLDRQSFRLRSLV